ncbi:glycosyltransferase [Palleronia sp. LCG004]|uniref:glycosyltransferase family 2 protein n=1 Tax=Palleronia sp. LCG004 TaxID=3079304 RepID=UPI0029422EAB|nr:glycosyltransferase [Palleronia sp. LCG004]WOI58255.1 glycosyltransferase [Palleronia sp. LCG004]
MIEAYDYIRSQSFDTLLVLFWFVAVFEIPRYFLLFALTAFLPARRPAPGPDARERMVSAVVVGHSEATKVEKCVRALHEQSRRPDEIVVLSDGSTDGMAKRVGALSRAGLIDAAHATELRSGKAAGLNLGARIAKGEIIVFVDCDCTFDRHAVRNILRHFEDPGVGAVAGSVLVRNGTASLLTAFQAIEYLITISLGKQAMDRLGLVSCISGAFGAYRRTAYEQTGGYDAEGGEDLDLTLSIRSAGWSVRFAEDAVCYTDVPVSRAALVRQRGRWERDSIRLRYRKHGHLMNPFSLRFSWGEWLHEVEFLVFNVLAAAALPFYVAWLFATYGSFAFSILVGAQLLLIAMDLLVFLMAASVTPLVRPGPLLPYVPGFSLYYGLFMRWVRLGAYAQEWIFRASKNDEFVPRKVQQARARET